MMHSRDNFLSTIAQVEGHLLRNVTKIKLTFTDFLTFVARL